MKKIKVGNWVLPEENAEGEGDPLHPDPDKGPVEVGLHHAGLALLQLKRVKEPEGEVEEGQEGDGLYRIIFLSIQILRRNCIMCFTCLPGRPISPLLIF